MKVQIVYPIPFDAWDTFEPHVRRFATTFKQFPPGHDYELIAVGNWGKPTDHVRQWFYGIKTIFMEYYGNGCDIGSLFHVRQNIWDDSFVIAMTSRCFFYRTGWLARYMEAREKHGRGLYGAYASHESGKPHICTRAYGMDVEILQKLPHAVTTRAEGEIFETGKWCLTSFVKELGLPTMQVTWDGEQAEEDWRKPDNVFRKGNQEQCLLWDRHTEIYRLADDTEKARLAAMADGTA